MANKCQFNLIDPDSIRAYLHKFSNGNAVLADYLCLALERPLRRRAENLSEINCPPADAPEWLLKKWDAGRPWHHFTPHKDIRLAARISHVTDWIKAAMVNDAAWLKRTDERGRPLKLLKIGTLEQALAEADKAMEIARQNIVITDDDAHTGHLMSFGDGYRIVRLLDTAALDRESACLGHCIGNGAYDDAVNGERYAYYSLRDRRNMPHVTLEVDQVSWKILQSKGKQNAPPIDKYVPFIKAFAQKYRLVPGNPVETGLLHQQGVYYDIFNLPGDIDIRADLEIDDRHRAFTFPQKLSMKGSLTIKTVRDTLTLPRSLSIDGNLDFGELKAKIAFPETMRVTGNLVLRRNAYLERLPDDCEIGGGLELPGCTGLRALPGSIRRLGGSLDLSGCSALEQLPEDLSIEIDIDKGYRAYYGAMNLTGCVNLRRLPARLFVEGPLYLNGCRSLRELPEELVVLGKIFTDQGIFDNVADFTAGFTHD